MSSTYRLVPVKEREASTEADALGMALAESRAWIGPFIVFLAGLNFKAVPSMTRGATTFELATGRAPEAGRIIDGVDAVYREVRDGYDTANVHGEILERYVYHVLAKPFPLRLGACRIERDDEQLSDYKLDAATNSECPAVAVEAKTSERALIGRRSARDKFTAKATWIIGLFDETEENVLAVFATWAPEARFREALAGLVGDEASKSALVYGHEQVAQLPSRIAALEKRVAKAAQT
jgi:hypothetical protein